ncbi:oxygen-independent coproporphyrinogen III oxidase [Flocculibacter collagenilyticus]|uniref:oxygen-independent coproporphyrinogen III oxidase n=1 Tax=Flocculibacter collagenilyticus TaxID=2744479 RepID=UPI001F19EBCA|nr:oxygen-independent coproporphyrinogen III oxidase [Flocculibacter collagenilyticus]
MSNAISLATTTMNKQHILNRPEPDLNAIELSAINNIEWDEALITKYNVSGPRYTSYPTALSFQPNYSADDVQHAINNSANNTLSLYIHIPFCHQLCYYCGCNKVITRHQHKADQYLDFLIEELTQQAPNFSHYTINQLHFGGGTPTFLTDEQMIRIMKAINAAFTLHKTAEVSIEIDPRSLRPSSLCLLKKLGFNRISIGIQDFNPDVQQAVNREQSYEQIAALFEQARALQFDSVNADFIYGLPHQTPESFKKSIDMLLDLSPDRVSVFNYAHLPERFAAQRKIDSHALPSPSHKLMMFKNTIQQMTQAGYQYIGIDHFAKKDDSLAIAQRKGNLHRNFQGYTTLKDSDLLGLGVSSISQIGSSIFQNEKQLKHYYKKLNEDASAVTVGLNLSKDDRIRAAVIKSLLCHSVLSMRKIEEQFNINFEQYFSDSLASIQPFITDELIQIIDRSIYITNKGRLFARMICTAFDAYISNTAQQQRYSRIL